MDASAPKKKIAERTILLVEDDRDIAESIADLLQEHGISAQFAANGHHAVQYLQDAIQLPRLILLDLMMPGMGGAEFRRLQLSRPEWASISTLIMSADPSVSDPGSNKRVPADGYLPKPINADSVLKAVLPYFASSK